MTQNVAQRLLSAEEFAQLEGDARRELARGEVIELGAPGGKHGDAQCELGMQLRAHAKARDLGWVTTETGFILARGADVVRSPDVAFVRKARVPDPIPPDHPELAPDLAVEVVSPRDTYEAVHAKVEEYLQAGVREVWVVDPTRRRAEVHRAERRPVFVTAGMELTTDLLPGLTLRLDELV